MGRLKADERNVSELAHPLSRHRPPRRQRNRSSAKRPATPDGTQETFGSGAQRVTIKVNTVAALRRLALNPDLAFGELYMDGRLTVEEGNSRGACAADDQSQLEQRLLATLPTLARDDADFATRR